jgi:hypothetical protein
VREPGIHELAHDEHSVPEPLDEFGRSLPPGAWPCPEYDLADAPSTDPHRSARSVTASVLSGPPMAQGRCGLALQAARHPKHR